MKRKKVLGLIKLLMVLAIIAILPVLALSDSKKADVKNKQSEAKMILKQIYAMQKAYKAEKGIYWIPSGNASASRPNGFVDIRIEIMSTARYTYGIASSDAGATNFYAEAVSGILDDDAYIDIWRIDQNGVLQVISDDAAN